jgi:hypothetical protein
MIELKIRFRRSSQHNNNNNNKRSKGTNQQHGFRDHRSEEVKLNINLLRIHMSSSMEPGDLLVGVNPLSLLFAILLAWSKFWQNFFFFPGSFVVGKDMSDQLVLGFLVVVK